MAGLRRHVVAICAAAAALAACGERSSMPASQILQTTASPGKSSGGPSYRVLFSFGGGSFQCEDGAWPDSELIPLSGLLYGTTYAGGTYDEGTIFDITPDGAEQVVYSFDGLGSLGGDGGGPFGGIIAVKGDYYGTTPDGGTYGKGTAFKIRTNSPIPIERVLHSFGASNDGEKPEAGVIAVGDRVYGTTNSGGAYGDGTVFGVDRKSGDERVLHSFGGGTDGANPAAALVEVNGKLYGTTSAGGTYGGGTLFSIRTDGGNERILHSFGYGPDGSDPQAAVIDVSGTLYGTTSAGGAYGKSATGGTVFSIGTDGKNERVLHSFGNGSDGADPQASVIEVQGTLYGTTAGGGAYGGSNRYSGTLYSLRIATGKERVLHSFGHGSDGEFPMAGPIDVNGTLYGTTLWGGENYSACVTSGGQTVGTVYALTL
jgi:uncharacterized repeat protein (TIGR03803 family)